MKSKGIKKTRKIFLVLLLLLVLIPALFYALLMNSRVQTLLVQRVATYLSAELDTRVEIGRLDVSFFLNVVLEDVVIADQTNRDMISARRVVLDVGRSSFRNRSLRLNRVLLDRVSLQLVRDAQADSYNLEFLVDYFRPDSLKRRPDRRSWNIICRSLELRNTNWSVTDHHGQPGFHGFDPRHFALKDLSMGVSGIKYEDDILSLNLDWLGFVESRGFMLQDMSGHLTLGPRHASLRELRLRSLDSSLSMDLEVTSQGTGGLFTHFFEDAVFCVTLDDSVLELADLGYFYPALYGIEGPLVLSGQFEGGPSALSVQDLVMSYGRETYLQAAVGLEGLFQEENPHLHFHVTAFQTSPVDIASFRMPLASGLDFVQVPENLFALESIAFNGRLYGQLSDFSTDGTWVSALGSISTQLDVGINPQSGLYTYGGKVSTDGFHLGPLVGADNGWLGDLALDLELAGEGFAPESMELMVSGEMAMLEIAGYNYQGVQLDAHIIDRRLEAWLLVDDPNAFFATAGILHFNEQAPLLEFEARLDQANLTRLHLFQRDSLAESVLSARVNSRATHLALDELAGHLDIDRLMYKEISLEPEGADSVVWVMHPEKISLSNRFLEDGTRIMQLRSSFVDADLKGILQISRIGAHFRQLLAGYLPAFYPDQDCFEDLQHDIPQDVLADLHLKDTRLISDLFMPMLRFSPDSRFKLGYQTAGQQIMAEGHAERFELRGYVFENLRIHAGNMEDGMRFESSADRLSLSEHRHADQFILSGQLEDDQLLYGVRWNAREGQGGNEGRIEGTARFHDRYHAEIRFQPSYALVNDSLWQINMDHAIYLDTARIEIQNLKIYNNRQFIRADGVLGPHKADRMYLSFNEFNIKPLNDMMGIHFLDVDGIVSGSVDFAAFRQPLSIEAALLVNNFAVNRELLGELALHSTWDPELSGFDIDARVLPLGSLNQQAPLLVSGYFYPGGGEQQLDLNIVLDGFKLSVFSRYLESFAQRFRGLASGRLRLEGPVSRPEVSGRVIAVDTGVRFDYLNTSYSFTHEVEIGKDFFRFNDLVLRDSLGNTGLSSGIIRHDLFQDFFIDMEIRPEGMMALNTSPAQNELFYGQAFGTGLVRIHGPEDQLVMDVSVRTDRGTQIYLPLYYTGEIVENRFIHFVSREPSGQPAPPPVPRVSGIRLNFDLKVTPDAEVQLIFDPQIGDIIRGRGSGDLQLEIGTGGVFNMFGDYTIEEGDYLFTLENLINKRFRIEQGSTIRWSGDVMDAEVDLRAAYRLRTSLYDLVMEVDTSDVYRRRVPVETVLILKDQLFNPTISFAIELPGGDEATREMLERLITTEQEMNRQVFSLLVLNRFLPTTLDQYNTALGFGVGSTSSELLSNQLSNWLSQISSDFDIGINYRPGDEISAQELEVALSTQLFDDRVLIDGQLGVAGDHPAIAQRASNIIGDVNIEVKLSPEGKFRVKAFNRSNAFDMINTNAPYTQGIGVFYRREFDALSELFRRRNQQPDGEQEE